MVRNKEMRETEEIKKQKTQEYLSEAKLPKISAERLQVLGEPITQEEIRTAINSKTSGKSPGPEGCTIRYYKKINKSNIKKMSLSD